jgi:hypothetical protein
MKASMELHQADEEGGQVALVAGAISKWAAGQPKWEPLPSDASLLGDLEFAPDDDVIQRAKGQLLKEGIIGRDDDGYYFAAIG